MNFNGFNENLGTRVKTAMRKIIAENQCTGNGIMIGRGQNLCYEGYEGFCDREKTAPIKFDTVYRMYSNTKVVTAAAAMQLWEKNCFSMSDPLYKFIPEYRHMKVVDESGRITDAQNPILIKHLFTMTSGLSYDDGHGYYDALAAKWRTARGNCDYWDTLRGIRELAACPLIFEPGSHYQYGLSFDVLGALIEIWSGMKFADYCKEYIFKPLGMNSTGFGYKDIDITKLACAYTKDENGILSPADGLDCPIIDVSVDYQNPTFASGGAGLLSTIGDYFKFARALALGGEADGVRILGKKTVEYLHTPLLNDIQQKDFAAGDPCCFGESFSYGLGMRVLVKPHTETYSSIGEWGWSGAMGTWLHIDPKENMYYVYVHQKTPAEHIGYIPYLNAAIYSSME